MVCIIQKHVISFVLFYDPETCCTASMHCHPRGHHAHHLHVAKGQHKRKYHVIQKAYNASPLQSNESKAIGFAHCWQATLKNLQPDYDFASGTRGGEVVISEKKPLNNLL